MGLERTEEGLQLGRKLFPTPQELKQHVESTRPILGFDSGSRLCPSAFV
jgi:hypothetical protein